MKFINGYWRIKEEIEPNYAVEYIDHSYDEKSLTVYAVTRRIEGRGDIINAPFLILRFTSPMEDIIKVSAVHFKGVKDKSPHFECADFSESTRVKIREEDKELIFETGRTSVRISKEKNNWKIEFCSEGVPFTESSYRNLAYMHNKETGKNYMVEQLAIDVDEYIYGLGERYTPFVKNGQTVEMWNEDGGTASEQTYKNIPFYVTNKGYGVFVDNPGDVQFEIGSEKVERAQFSVQGERLEYYMINGGTVKNTVKKYTDLTGKPALPPAWSFGLWLSTSFTTNYDEETVTGFIDGMKEREIPLHVFHFDCFWQKEYEWCNFKFNEKIFPDPKGMLKRYRERGMHICVWINSYISQKSYLFDEGAAKGYFVKKADGDVWQVDRWQGGMALVDFTNPHACKWFQDKLEAVMDFGVDCFKTDFGERIPVTGVQYYDGSDTVKMHNYYTYLYNKTVFELLERKSGKGNALVFARSTAAGGQKFPVHWGGDCTAVYSSMAEELRGGLSLALCGYGFWSHDISGFEQTASPDLYKRWCAFGLLSTHSRLHGSKSYRVPWFFDEEASRVLKHFVNIKCRLMPYLYEAAVTSHEEGIPVMRPLVMEFGEDKTAEFVDKEYMLGESLLVAPVFKENGEVTYYLPAGNWTNYLTGEKKTGEKWYKETFDYYTLPLMVRENSLVPVGREEERPEYDYCSGLTLKVYELQEGKEIHKRIVDQKGETALQLCVVRKGDRIFVAGDKDIEELEIEVVNETVLGIEKRGKEQILCIE